VRIFSHEECILDEWMTSKKGLHVILVTIFLNQSPLGAIFAHIFREFAQIFTKSKLLGVRLHQCSL